MSHFGALGLLMSQSGVYEIRQINDDLKKITQTRFANSLGMPLNASEQNDLQPLTDYLLAVESGDDSADECLDLLIAKVPIPELVEAVCDLLSHGPQAAWIGAVQLAGLLGSESPQLWASLIDAIQSRIDLGTAHLMAGIALLQVVNHLPERGRCRELAEEWAEDQQTLTLNPQSPIIAQLQSEPETAIQILENFSDFSDYEQSELIDEIQSQTGSAIQSKILNWLAYAPGSKIHKNMESTSDLSELKNLQLSGWVTDLTGSGQFGAGLETAGETANRFIVGGSWNRGMRLFERMEVASDAPDFIPELALPRLVCTHLTLVKYWLSGLLESGWNPDFLPSPSAWTAGYLRHEILTWSTEDEAIWESWTEILVDKNPLNTSAEALKKDAELICQAVPHWFRPDELAVELATEFQRRSEPMTESRIQSAVRVWFERTLGPMVGDLVTNLSAMSYFWLALAESDVMNQQQLMQLARASARIASDLNDPARVVANHPFIRAWSEQTFAVAFKLQN
jgi:hypothetical protein